MTKSLGKRRCPSIHTGDHESEPISRRTLCMSGLLLAGCRTAVSACFGKIDPPSSQRLVYLNGSEPDSLDPATSGGGYDVALFEGLTYHPTTAQPMAGPATHYEVNDDFNSIHILFARARQAAGRIPHRRLRLSLIFGPAADCKLDAPFYRAPCVYDMQNSFVPLASKIARSGDAMLQRKEK